MRSADYAVIRYVADPGRNEARNVGLIIWDEHDCRLYIDDLAVERVVRENTFLERDALLYLEPFLRDELSVTSPFNRERFLTLLNNQRWFPVILTEPRYTTLQEDQPGALEATLERLLKRVVRPGQRGGGSGFNPVRALAKRLRPLIQQQVLEPNHFFTASLTGLPRKVDFYANHGANTALDTLRLAIKDAGDIRTRVDAEAFKIEDICSKNNVNFIVYCAFSNEQALADANESARHVMTSVGATVVTNLDDAAREVELAVGQTADRQLSVFPLIEQ